MAADPKHPIGWAGVDVGSVAVSIVDLRYGRGDREGSDRT
jgi:hypothetical protein